MDQISLPIEVDDDTDDLLITATDLVVYSRDWTVQTIISQIQQGNIDLYPKFQRRNAWKDDKRMRLIESLLLKYPVPEIVLAERKDKKRSFIVIDGKQRLQTLAGLYMPEQYNIWESDKFQHSKLIPEISRKNTSEFINSDKYSDLKRMLDNADIRCTVISNYSNEDVLYDIFYRLNTGSSPLSSQELRQVLNKGKFSEMLISLTNETKPIHKVLEIESADDRLMDVELSLRCLAFYVKGKEYKGNQKKFLDDFVRKFNAEWDSLGSKIEIDFTKIMNALTFMDSMIGYEKIGRKLLGNEFDWRFNKMLFEVQTLYAIDMDKSILTDANINDYKYRLGELLDKDYEFKSSIESSTKTIEKYKIRFEKYESIMRDIFGDSVIYTLPFK